MPETYNCALRVVCGKKVYIPVDYVEECEHQDGEEYWDQFKTLDDLFEDVDLYFINQDEG